MDNKRVEDYVTNYLSDNLDSRYIFHSLDRTKDLISKTIKILDSEDNKVDKNITILAAWFLNTGFTKDFKSHISNSQKVAESFLLKENMAEKQISEVTALIASAWNENEPESKEAEVLKDVQTAYYASEDFIALIELQRIEILNFGGKAPSTLNYRNNFLNILNGSHQYYTKYANKKWREKKEKNALSLIKKSLKSEKNVKKEKLKVKLKNQSPERAIQSLYRTQLKNHIKLSDIADTKANILLSVNAIIISLLISNLIPKLDVPKNSYLIYPTIIFIVFSIASIIMSVLATRPKVENKDLINDELDNKNTNFLFFGNFYSLSLPDFKIKIKDIIKSKESIYDSLTMDLYFLGLVLKKKYQLLRWTYTVFIIGILLSVIAFAIALKYYGMGEEIIEAVTPD